MIKLRHLAAASAVVLTLAVAAPPASAQWIVYDPTNFSQNVLTAARELQQINNQITMLTNQATSLVNQARNLANLPMSTLTQLQSSIAQTQSLLGQAQNIAFNVQRIEQAYSTSYGTAAGTGSTTAMVANAQTRWQNSVARLRGQPEGPGGRGRQHPDQLQRDDLAGHGQPERHRRACRRRRPATSFWRCNPSSSPTSSRCCRPRAGPMRWSRRVPPPPRRRASRTTRPSRRAPAISPATSPCSAATEARRCWDGRRSSAPPRSSP